MENLKSLINELQEASDNKCGTSIIKLMDLTNLTLAEINPLLRQLYDEKYIRTRKGINSILIFLNKQ